MTLMFTDWTAKAIELRIVEAMETHMMLPSAKGPQEYGNAMPETVRETWKDAAPTEMKVRKRITPGAIDRMEETWEWQNTMLCQKDRVFINDWARAKVSKSRKVHQLSDGSSAQIKWINREKTRVCAVIANNLNRLYAVRLTMAIDEVSENQASLVHTTITSQKCAVTNWRAADAKPTDHNHPDREELRKRLERFNARRSRAA